MANGTPLPEKIRRRVARLVPVWGETPLRKKLQVSRSTLERALAGLPLRRGSLLLITGNLPDEDGGSDE